MSKKMLIFMVIFSLGLVALSLYIISTLDPGVKPKPTSVVSNLEAQNIKVNDAFKLKFSDGSDFTFSSLKNKYSLVYFGFMNCPDVCPEILSKLEIALSHLNDKEKELVQVIFVSVDHERDDLNKLHEFISQFAGISAATGDSSEIDKLTKSLKAYYAKVENGESKENDYNVDHSAFIYFLNPEVKLISQLTPEATSDDIVKEIKNKLK